MSGKKEQLEELRRKVGRIRLLTLRLVSDRLSGEYHSSFKGQGIEFDEARPYVPGDDIRQIDWNVTARTSIAHIKRFSEERELTVLFLVDVSSSQGCGSAARTKGELSALVASLLAMSATENGDNVGLVKFSDRIEGVIPPGKGRGAVMRLVRDILLEDGDGNGSAKRRKTAIAAALGEFNNLFKRRALVFLVSDFMDKGYFHELKTTAKRHDLVAVSVSCGSEDCLPDAGVVDLVDPETGIPVPVDTSSPELRALYAEETQKFKRELGDFFKSSKIDHVELSTADDDDTVVLKLRKLFLGRAKRICSRPS